MNKNTFKRSPVKVPSDFVSIFPYQYLPFKNSQFEIKTS